MRPLTFLASRRTLITHHHFKQPLSKMSTNAPDGIVIGIRASQLNESSQQGLKAHSTSDIAQQWSNARIADPNKPGQLRVFYPSKQDEPVIAAVSVQGGEVKPAPTTAPDTVPAASTWLRNEHLEQTRLAAAKGVRSLRDLPLASGKDANQRKTLAIDSFTSPHAAATGAGLALWRFNHFKSRGPNAAFEKEYDLQGGRNVDYVPLQSQDQEGAQLLDQGDELKQSTVPLSWKTGHVYAEAQNWTRELAETPANHLTPSIYCDIVKTKLGSLKNISMEAHDEAWARAKGMGSFISVTQGTDEPAKMLEVHYNGAGKEAPLLGLVGKGITFDTGKLI